MARIRIWPALYFGFYILIFRLCLWHCRPIVSHYEKGNSRFELLRESNGAVAACCPRWRAAKSDAFGSGSRDPQCNAIPADRNIDGSGIVTAIAQRTLCSGRAIALLNPLSAAQPPSRRIGAIVHMGTLEDDMVTYLVKEGAGNDQLFTREDMQLEAYCTGIGKVLLAGLPTEKQEQYLANGPFVALTDNTTIDAATLREELACVTKQGFAVDNREISPDLYCLAVPVPSNDTAIALGISVSRLGEEVDHTQDTNLIASMHKTAFEIADILTSEATG